MINYNNAKKLYTALRYEPWGQVLNNIYRRIFNRSIHFEKVLKSNNEIIGLLNIDRCMICFDDILYIKAIISLSDLQSHKVSIIWGQQEQMVLRKIIDQERTEICVIKKIDPKAKSGELIFEKLNIRYRLYSRNVQRLTGIDTLHRLNIFQLKQPKLFEGMVDSKLQLHSSYPALPDIQYPDTISPPVTIIIPTKDQVELLKTCVHSIIDKTKHPYHVVIINNRSEEPQTKSYIQEIIEDERISIFDYDKPFNYAAMHNAVMNVIDTDYVCFLNNDVEIMTHEWLGQMMRNFQLNDVGAVGCRLYYPNGAIQHDGIYFNMNSSHPYVDHINVGLQDTEPLFYHMPRRALMIGVTAACMLTNRDTFLRVGGFDEDQFPIAFNDVDYCLKLVSNNKKIILHTDVHHIHHESVTRSYSEKPTSISRGERKSFQLLLKKWRPFILNKNDYPLNDIPSLLLESWKPNRPSVQ